jgi:hypothetical protein
VLERVLELNRRCLIFILEVDLPAMRSARVILYPPIWSVGERASSEEVAGEWRSWDREDQVGGMEVSAIRIRAIGSDLIKVGGFRSRFCQSAPSFT